MKKTGPWFDDVGDDDDDDDEVHVDKVKFLQNALIGFSDVCINTVEPFRSVFDLAR